MSIFLFFVSIIIMVAAYKGTHPDLFAVLKDDFTGETNFIFWVLAVILIVAVGNIKQIKRVSDAFLILVVIGIIFAQYQGGTNLLQSFMDQVRRGTRASKPQEDDKDNNGLSLDLGGNLEGLTG